MTEKLAYSYTVLHYIHDVVSGEMHHVNEIRGTGSGTPKALLSCHAISIIRALRLCAPGSINTFWQISA